MVQYCVAYGCKEKCVKGSNVTFHSFPSNEDRRKLWTLALRRDNFNPSKHARLCSKHFLPECFDNAAFGLGRKLKDDTVPTVFDFPEHLQIKTKKRKLPKKRSIEPALLVSATELLSTNESVSSDQSPLERHHETSPQKKKRKLRASYLGDYTESTVVSPSKSVSALKAAKATREKSRRKIKSARQKCRRAVKKVGTLQSLLSHLKKEALISENASDILEKSLPAPAVQLLLRQRKGSTREEYPVELKTFALTLNFYSSRAYSYVRKTFSNCLPHPTTLRKWYQSVDGKPGFSSEARIALKLKAAQQESLGRQPIVCSLMVDEMCIRKHVDFDGKNYVGFVDCGAGLSDDALPVAKEAWVFMVVALNSNWKIPAGYFLIDGLNGTERGNIVVQCLAFLNECQVDVVSLTFDGTITNFSMARSLGAKLTPPNMQTWFENPFTGSHIYIFLDPCHMLKLIRNALAFTGRFSDESGTINWHYFVKLEELQNREGLHLATKLTKRHINWSKEKMRVKLAAQTFSQSVADALRYCEEDLNLLEFQGCKPTINFVSIINNLFDIFNSRNLLSKGFKAPMSQKNSTAICSFLKNTKLYLMSLCDQLNGTKLYLTKRKTGFVGFLICIDSLLGLYDSIVKTSKMNFLLTYKMSQDHLEVFFSAVRSHGGHNNNPTAKQFEAAFKRLLVHIQIGTTDSANCLAVDTTTILNAKSGTVGAGNESDFLAVPQTTLSPNVVYINHDHNYVPKLARLSPYVEDVVGYIAGFVVRKIGPTIDCVLCNSVLKSSISNSKLLQQKNKGGLVIPSEDVVSLCHSAEKVFRSKTELFKLKNPLLALAVETMGNINSSLFDDLSDHILEQEPIENHKTQLIRAILQQYFKIRLHHVGKRSTERLHQQRIRSFHTKIVLFKNQ